MRVFTQRFKEIAARYPKKAAIVDMEGQRKTSYEELDELSDKIAALLVERNIKQGSFLPVLLPRKMEFIAAAIGILKAGCVLAPLSSAYPKERIAFIQEQCKSDWIIQEDFIEEAKERDLMYTPRAIYEAEDAIIIYTSGSTGAPKGIVHSHKSIYCAAERIAKKMEFTEKDVFLSNAPYHFIAFMYDLFSTLFQGVTIHVHSEKGYKDVHRIEDYVLRHKITAFFISPQMLKIYENKSPSLRLIIVGGERLINMCGHGYDVINVYGSSETAGCSTCLKVDKAYENTPIGTPYDGVDVYILDEKGNPVTEGEVGEICITGPMAEGYLYLPEKTAQAFVENPFSKGEDDKVLYHSGDLGKRLPDGNLLYVNRKDWMVKVNGQRVEIGEIEANMNSLPYVRAGVVKSFENQYGQTYLCGYFQLFQNAEVENPAAAIGAELKKKLPEYMIPQFLVHMEQLPLNANGKIDRLSLTAPDASIFKKEYEAPETEQERILCSAFEAVLQMEQIGRNDDFFALGGDSITALRLQNQCKELGLTSPQIFEGKTPEKIAQLCTVETSGQEGLYADCKVEKDFYPLTDSQMGVFLECMRSPESVMYNIPICLDVPMQVDAVRLKEAVRRVIDHYPVLKIKVGERDGGYGMIPCPDRDIYVDEKETTDDELLHIKEHFVRAFDLENGPLFRVELYRTPSRLCLLADFHHMICDGASVAEFFRQVSLAYDGGELETEELTQLDLSNYEETLKDKEIYKNAQEYFERQLAGNEVDSNPVFDKQPEDTGVKPSRRYYRDLHGSISVERLEQFTREGSVTENTFFLSAFAYALAKYTGQEEALFATVNNGRHDPRLRCTHGMLVRTLPIYVNMDEENTVKDYLNTMQKGFFETMKHDCCSFGELARQYGVTSDLMFVYQAETLNSVRLGAFEVSMDTMETGCSLANITLHVFRKNGSYDMFFEYRSDIYEEETIEAFSGLYLRILEGFLQCNRLRDITLVSEQENQILDSFCGEEVPYDKSETVVDLFRRQAEETPEHQAVIYQEKKFTYGQLDQITDNLGAYVKSRGLGAEDVVSVLIPRCEYMPIASLGVLKSGAAYQPLDPTYPMDRIAFMMEDAKVKLLIVDESLLPLVPEYEGEVLLTKDIPSLPEAGECEAPKPEDLFILLYTSGTTGTPKGCMLTHKNIRAFCNWYHRFYQVGTSSKVTAYASYGFDANMMETYPALTCGATLYIVPEELRLELTALNEYFEKEQITHSFMTTQVGRQFAAEIENHGLKFLSTGGEALASVQAESDFTFCNLYGPTESTVLVTAFKVDKNEEYTNIPIGSAIDNTELYVLDKYSRRLPVGALGELCVAGEQVSRGYLNRPEQTETVYTANPVKEKAGYERVYHTGDIVRFLPDGNIQFIGRRDGQVKIRGFRIELPEVAGIIQKFPAIRDVAVTAFDVASGGKAIAAYVVSDEPVDVEALGDFIREEKPPYMVPAVTIQIDRIPLNQNGKLDRRALPEPDVSSLQRAYEAPETEEERILCSAFEAVLQMDKIGRKDDFFALGGNSITALKLQSQCKALGLTGPQIFEGKTPEKIAQLCIGEMGSSEDLYADCKVERDFYPLTDSQMGVFLECMQNPETMLYNIPICLDVPAQIDVVRLKDAVEQVIDHYPVLKIKVGQQDGAYGMIPCPDREIRVPLEIVDEEGISAIKVGFRRAFDLENGPLFRIELYQTDSGAYLLADFHHMISDGGSVTEFFRQVSLAYDGKELEIEELTQLDLSNYEETLKDKEIYKKAQEYFEGQLAGNEVDSNPVFDMQPEEEEIKPSARYYRDLHQSISVDRLEQFTREGGMTENTFFMGAFAYALAKYTGQEEALFATVNNGRHDPRLRCTQGMLVRTLPIYVNMDEENTVKDYLNTMQKDFFETMKHDCCSFGELARQYGVTSDLMFVYQAEMLGAIEVGGFALPMEQMETGCSPEYMAFNVFRRDDSYELLIQYRSDIYEEETIEAFSGLYLRILEGFLQCNRLRDITLVSERENQILDSFCGEEVPYDKSETVVDLFRRQAEETPEQPAVIYQEKKFTYGQLDQITDNLGAYVKSRGLGAEDVVSVLIPRCEYMPIASLGVLKSGAAYQPLDPTYPMDRIAFMMEDAKVKLLIVDESLLPLVPEYEGEVLLTKDIPSLPEAGECEAPKPEDLFILLYTSGTTGTPKGCMLTHKNIRAFCNWYHRFYQVGTSSKVTAYASYGFDANMMETYPALTCGATLYIVPEELRLELTALNEYFEKEQITHSFMTTQVGRQFAAEIENHGLKFLSTGGEALASVQAESDFTFCNLYGPTESTVLVTAFKVDKNEEYTNIPIGSAIDNTELYVLDKYSRRLPVGALGELCVAGEQVSRGYLNRPEQTETVYTTNPVKEKAGYERVYHTGDIVRFLPDGNIQFIGRRDGQVKIRGFRIELPEVAGIIQKFPAIRDVAVTAFDVASGGKAIAAYVVSDEPVDVEALGDFIREEKPPYMVPAVTIQIERIPLNQNGKLDRRALPDPKQQVSSAEKDSARPLSLLEKELSETVGEILGHRDFSVDTNLMHVGLTSLSAIKLVASIHKEYGVSLEVKQMMKTCSILSMEDAIYTELRQGKAETNVQSQQTRFFYPLTQTQMGVFYDAAKDPENTNYNIPSLIRFPKNLTASKLLDAVKQTAEAHPYLNTTLEYREGKLVQFPGDAETIIHKCSMTEEELTAYVSHFVKPFELVGGPLYRLSVVETEEAVCLLTDFHHIIFDGGSMDIFLRQIIAACDGVTPEKEDYTYFDFAVEEEQAEGKEQYQRAAAHFHQLLAGCEGASEMTAELQEAEETGTKRESVALCDEKAVDAFCRANQVTPAHLFLGAVFYTLARYLSSQEVYISTISSGRSNPKLQNSVGMFVKTLPLAGSIAGEKTVLDFINEAKEGMLSSMEHESYPFTKLAADYNFNPQIMYACQLGVMEEMRCQGQSLVMESIDENRPKFKISIHIEERDNCPAVCVQYNDALYRPETMEQLAGSIAVCVQRMVANPKGKLSELSLVTRQQQAILDQFWQCEAINESENSQSDLFHGMFEQQADRQPEKAALIACDGSWTYSQLEQAMNRIANGLISRGFDKGQTAVILLPRKGSLIQAMYGVMKAGGAYIPCDPEYPEERILQITRDSGASVIISTKEVLADRGNLENTVDVEELLAFSDSSRPEAGVQPDDVAYMIYTSGSTGKPKGVILEHRGIANYLKNHQTNSHVHICVTDGSVMVSVTTVSFDMSLKETALALCNGLTLVLADEDTANHPVHLAKLMEETGGDIFNATPSRMLQYMDSKEFCQSLAGCRVVMSGGEAYSLKLLEKLQSITKARIINTYGPTEITVSCNAKELTEESSISIGRPLLHYTEYIADSDGNLLPPGVTGELYIGGKGVARGYHNLPEMTEERFISLNGERVYKSGDYAKWTESGDVIILGRTDNQVKLRGLRIELSEIETCIGEYPSIKNAVVIIRKLEDTEHLCAYYTAEKPVAADQLKAFLGEKLTRYMVPTGFCQLPQLPMTPNGKIDRKKLPDPELTTMGEYVAPVSEEERTFCKIFEEVLHLERVGSCDDFFDLGGTSLMVTRVIIMATESGFDITYGDVFTHSTPKALAEMFSQEEGYTSGLEDLSKYDYSRIKKVLTQNNLETFQAGEAQPLGNVLITGATGFLGIHILREFLETEAGTAYCILRKGQYDSLEDRLKSLLFYYFENTYEEEMGTRILLKEGDITDRETFEALKGENIHTVINCAANVKHFSSGTDIEDVNIGGVENAIEFCRETGSRIVQISTTSVSGFRVGSMPPAGLVMRETMLYFGQVLDTKYGHSKFVAERLVLEAVADGLDGKIMRVGNLSARDTDGEFQMNYGTNSFVGRLKAFETIGKFPYSMMDSTAEMAPIDSTAQAILTLAKTPKGCCVFHPYNNHSIYLGDIIHAMKNYGVDIELADDDAYFHDLEEAQKDPEKAVILSSMIAYENMGHGQKIEGIAKVNEYTMQTLYRLGFHWPTTSKEYVGRFVEALGGLGYFM